MSTPPKKFIEGSIGIFRFSVLGFLVALVLMFGLSPLFHRVANGQFLATSLVTVFLICGVMAVGHRRQTMLFGLALLVPVMALKWGNHFRPDIVSMPMYIFGNLIFVIFIIYQFMRFILKAPRVDSEVVCAGISVYLLIGLAWSFAYIITAWLVPNSFYFDGQVESPRDMDSFTSVYFSFVTLTTVGYGDITPVSDIARMLAASESMTGTLFVAILISRLVSLYSKETESTGDENKIKK